MRHVCIRSGRPAVATYVIDVGTAVRGSRRSHRSFLGKRLRKLTLAFGSKEWIASSDEEGMGTNRSCRRSIDRNRHCSQGLPRVAGNVVSVMICRCKPIVPMAGKVNEPTRATVTSPAHRYRNRCTRRVPCVGNRIVLPGLALLSEGRPIEATDDIDFAVPWIIRRSWAVPDI